MQLLQMILKLKQRKNDAIRTQNTMQKRRKNDASNNTRKTTQKRCNIVVDYDANTRQIIRRKNDANIDANSTQVIIHVKRRKSDAI